MAYKYHSEEVLALDVVVQNKIDEYANEGWRLISVTDLNTKRYQEFSEQHVPHHRILLIFEKLIRATRKKKVVD